MVPEGRDPAWDCFSEFYEWAVACGYQPGDVVKRRSQTLPWGPQSCFVARIDLRAVGNSDWRAEFCQRWDESVNRIRAAYGLPLIKEDFL